MAYSRMFGSTAWCLLVFTLKQWLTKSYRSADLYCAMDNEINTRAHCYALDDGNRGTSIYCAHEIGLRFFKDAVGSLPVRPQAHLHSFRGTLILVCSQHAKGSGDNSKLWHAPPRNCYRAAPEKQNDPGPRRKFLLLFRFERKRFRSNLFELVVLNRNRISTYIDDCRSGAL